MGLQTTDDRISQVLQQHNDSLEEAVNELLGAA
jgi:hypothetical protein